jgi:hypothetical protein
MLKKTSVLLLCCSFSGALTADEGMWMLNEPDSSNFRKMQAMGYTLAPDLLYSPDRPSIKDAVVVFNGGCTAVAVSGEGLIFTNHHCGYDAIQAQSSTEHDYLKDGFAAHSRQEEMPVPGVYVSHLIRMENLTDRFLSLAGEAVGEDERAAKTDSLTVAIQDSVSAGDPFIEARVVSCFKGNAYYLYVYENFTDVRMVFAPPSSVGKFGGDTDNWMWPRHTGDFSVFRVYAGSSGRPADFDPANVPWKPPYHVPVSLDGYRENDFSMTVGFPGRTERYLSSWGVAARMNHSNAPRIKIRSILRDIRKEAMQGSDEIRIMYASKHAMNSNYWKYSIGMNRSIERLGIVERKKALERQFQDWLDATPDRKAIYGEALKLMEKGYCLSGDGQQALTCLTEALVGGAEIVDIATRITAFNPESSTEERENYLKNVILPSYKDYSPEIDEKVLAAMLKAVREMVPAAYLPDIYGKIDGKYGGNCEKYAADLFKKSVIPYLGKLVDFLRHPKKSRRLDRDPACELAMSCRAACFDIAFDSHEAISCIERGERLFMNGLLEMPADRKFYPDADFTMRMSYGRIGGYAPCDAARYDCFTTTQGIFEKYRKDDPEFDVRPEILDLLREKDFGRYGNGRQDMNVCFISDNDISGGNSGSPVFNGRGHLIGLAFDGNWEAMSSDVSYEPLLQRAISVDVRYLLFMIEKWGKCRYLFDEIRLIRETAPADKLPE